MKKKEKNAVRDAKRKAVKDYDTPEKLMKDWSAEERFVNRSKKIRKKIQEWMFVHTEEKFETSGVLCDECANFAKCSSITAYRWIHQFSAPSAKFRIVEDDNGLMITLRA